MPEPGVRTFLAKSPLGSCCVGPQGFRTFPGYSSVMESELVYVTPASLALYHQNPRLGSVTAIRDSLRAHGQYKPVVVNRGTHTGRPMEVLAGNHTVKAFRDLLEAEPDKDEWRLISAVVIDVDDDEAKRIVLVDNRTPELGDGYDNAVLTDLLSSLGDLSGTGYTDEDLAGLLAGVDDLVEDPEPDAPVDPYTHSSDIPQYTPTGECPAVDTLVDTTRTQLLEDAISAADLPENVRIFLMAAAQRHTVIDFRAVAEFYAHQSPEVQRLMEAQALVIIDVDDAIARGYAHMRTELHRMFDDQLAIQQGEDDL